MRQIEKIHPKIREQFCWIINFNRVTNEEHRFVFELKVNMNKNFASSLGVFIF